MEQKLTEQTTNNRSASQVLAIGALSLGAPGEVMERYRAAARADHDQDWVQVREGGEVILHDDGHAWVSGWIRVDPEDLGQCEACGTAAPQDPSGRLDDPWGKLCQVCADRVSETIDRERVSLRRAIRMVQGDHQGNHK